MGLVNFQALIVSASRPPPRPLDAQRFFGGAVLGCFLVLLLSRCFLSLSWVLSGTPSNSLGVFGTSLGPLWEPLGPLSGILGSLLGLLGLVGPLLGCSFGLSSALLDSLGLLLGVPFRTSWPKRRPGSDKVPQDSPKSRPRDPQGSQKGPPKV